MNENEFSEYLKECNRTSKNVIGSSVINKTVVIKKLLKVFLFYPQFFAEKSKSTHEKNLQKSRTQKDILIVYFSYLILLYLLKIGILNSCNSFKV